MAAARATPRLATTTRRQTLMMVRAHRDGACWPRRPAWTHRPQTTTQRRLAAIQLKAARTQTRSTTAHLLRSKSRHQTALSLCMGARSPPVHSTSTPMQNTTMAAVSSSSKDALIQLRLTLRLAQTRTTARVSIICLVAQHRAHSTTTRSLTPMMVHACTFKAGAPTQARTTMLPQPTPMTVRARSL